VIRLLIPTCFCHLLALYSIHTCSSNMEAFVCLGRWKRFWLKSPMYSQWTALLLYVVIFMASFMTWWSFFRRVVMFPVQTTFLWLANTSIIPCHALHGSPLYGRKSKKVSSASHLHLFKIYEEFRLCLIILLLGPCFQLFTQAVLIFPLSPNSDRVTSRWHFMCSMCLCCKVWKGTLM